MISVFVYLVPLARGVAVLGLVGGASPPRASPMTVNAIAARLQGPFLGVNLDALSLDAAETRRDACEKSGFDSSARRAYAARAGF